MQNKTTNTLKQQKKQYNKNRYQRVSINNHFSDLLPVVLGVP